MTDKENNSRTVGCSFKKLIPDETHKEKIHDAVNRVHKATILATELINIHIRNELKHHQGEGLHNVLLHNYRLQLLFMMTCTRSTLPSITFAVSDKST